MADDFSPRFEILGILGQGSFGSVFKVISRDDSKTYALKVLDIPSDVNEKHDIMKEIYIMLALVHPNIIKYYKALNSPPIDDKPSRTAILIEFCEGGDLERFTKERKGKLFSLKRLLKWMKELSSAVCYLHKKSIMHRDLKPSNIFLDQQGNIKLGDFGVSRVLTSTMAATIIGTPMFMAPEALYGQYNYKADIYSLGCVFLCMATARAFPRSPSGQFVQPPPTSVYGPEITELILNCLSHEAANRPTAEDIIQVLSIHEESTGNITQTNTIRPSNKNSFQIRPNEQDYNPDGLDRKLRLHQVFSPNISVSGDVAKRDMKERDHGLVFSNRPINIEEEVTFEVHEVSGSGFNLVSFGFTTADPRKCASRVPDTIRKLDSLGETWVVSRYEKIECGTKFSYHYNAKGNIFTTCKGREKYRRENQLLKPDKKVWAVFSISFQVIAVKIVDVSNSGLLKMESVIGFPGKPLSQISEEYPTQDTSPINTPLSTVFEQSVVQDSVAVNEEYKPQPHINAWLRRQNSTSSEESEQVWSDDETTVHIGKLEKEEEDTPRLVKFKSVESDDSDNDESSTDPVTLRDPEPDPVYKAADEDPGIADDETFATQEEQEEEDDEEEDSCVTIRQQTLDHHGSLDDNLDRIDNPKQRSNNLEFSEKMRNRRHTVAVEYSMEDLETAKYPPPDPINHEDGDVEVLTRNLGRSKSTRDLHVDESSPPSRITSVRNLKAQFEDWAKMNRK